MGEDDVAEELATATAGLSEGSNAGSWGTKSSGNSGWETNEPKGDTSSGW